MPGAPRFLYHANPRAEMERLGDQVLSGHAALTGFWPLRRGKEVFKTLVADLGMQMRKWGVNPFVVRKGKR